MKQQIVFVTLDAVHHETEISAVHHINKIYGEKLSSLAARLIQTNFKYTNILQFIDEHVEEFAELKTLKAALKLED